jgi:hypothetical protein
MFKGSWQDKSHFIIPFISMPLSIILAYFVKLDYQVMFIIMPAILTLLQAMNEAFQAIDPKVSEKYENFEAFQKNSKLDWKLYFLGLFLGMIISVILVGII